MWLAGSLCCLLLACSQERQPCLTPKTASFNIECVHYPTDSAITTIDTALPYAIFTAVAGGGLKSVVYTIPSSVFTISLSPVTDSCTWILQPDTTTATFSPVPDTFSFYYTRQLQFLSNACGYTYFFTFDSLHATHNNIDSALITNRSVTNNVNTAKQLTLYFKPDW